MSQNELVKTFDDAGNEIVPQKRSAVHTKPLQFWHGVVNVWVVNLDKRLLCSKRSLKNEGNPGKWQTYFGGHVKAGFTYEEAVTSELEEELGLSIDSKKLFLIDEGRYEESRHIYKSFVYIYTGDGSDLFFNDGEIEAIKWMSLSDYSQEKELNPDEWCNGCSLENQKRISETVDKYL